jgi:prepilin-type N-terminal cleavage/methylation domain-containing protein
LTRDNGAPISPRNRSGFTLVELMVGMVVFSIIVGFLFVLYARDQRAEATSLDLAEAQQNARTALDVIARELRSAGYGLDNTVQPAIEVASAYRLTFVMDLNGNSAIDAGERITYFLDGNLNDPTALGTRNPRDRVLRRVASTSVDSFATPVSGAGSVIAYGLTQAAGTNGVPVTPLFTYLTQGGANLATGTNDPEDVFYGPTLADSSLGKPAGNGKVSVVATVLVQVVTETARPQKETGTYRSVTLTGRVAPRAAPYLPVLALATIPPGGGGGGGGDTTGGIDTTGGGTDTLPPYVPPIRIATDQVLSLALLDTNELDANEGSYVTVNDQRDVDIVVGTKTGSSNNLYVWWNGYPNGYSGATLFQETHSWTGISGYDLYTLRAGSIDGNGDDHPDLLAGVRRGTNQGAIQTWFNQSSGGTYGVLGSGTYPSATSPNGTYYQSSGQITGEVRSLAVGDIDGDGDLDAVAGCKTSSTAGAAEVWFSDGTGGFSHGNGDTYSASGNVFGVALADINADGFTDIVGGCPKNNTTGYINVWLQNDESPGNFHAKVTYTVPGSVYAIAAADMDDDGDPDVVVGTNTGSTSGNVEFWRNESGTLVQRDVATANGPVLCLAIGPLDYGNDAPDLVAGNSQQSVEAWWVDPAGANGDILPTSPHWSDAVTGGQVNAVAIGKLEGNVTDPNADILNDIVAGVGISSTAGEIDIYLNPYVATLQQ